MRNRNGRGCKNMNMSQNFDRSNRGFSGTGRGMGRGIGQGNGTGPRSKLGLCPKVNN